MDTLEQGIHAIDAHTQEAIKKHKDIFAKTVYNTATKSNKSALNFDKQYKYNSCKKSRSRLVMLFSLSAY